MKNDKKAATAGTGTASNTTFNSQNSNPFRHRIGNHPEVISADTALVLDAIQTCAVRLSQLVTLNEKILARLNDSSKKGGM